MRDHPCSVMLFAAGFGTRMGPLTANQPKPMIHVAGRPLIDHALNLVNGHGTARIVANLHYKPARLEQHLAGTGVLLSREQPDILETGGGLRKALPLLGDGPVFTMNTDAVWHGPNPLTQLAELWRPDNMDALLLCIPKSQALGYKGNGDFLIGNDGRAARGPGAVYSGVQILKTGGLNDIADEKFSLNLLWDRMLAENRLFAALYPGQWCDVGRPESVPLAESMLGYRDV